MRHYAISALKLNLGTRQYYIMYMCIQEVLFIQFKLRVKKTSIQKRGIYLIQFNKM